MVTTMRRMLPIAMLVGSVGVAAGQEPAARITTDSRDYCIELASRLALLPGAEDETVRRLAADGLHLCERGHLRTGIAKLRRAIRVAQARP